MYKNNGIFLDELRKLVSKVSGPRVTALMIKVNCITRKEKKEKSFFYIQSEFPWKSSSLVPTNKRTVMIFSAYFTELREIENHHISDLFINQLLTILEGVDSIPK